MTAPLPPIGFSRTAIMAVVMLGALGSLAVQLQPLMLGQLAREGAISLGQIGQTAMLEGLGMAIAASCAGFRLKPENLRAIALAAIAISACVNLLCGNLVGIPFMVLRFFGGISAGLMSWLWVGMLSRHPVPARLCAIFILLQSLTLLALSFLFSNVVFAWRGASASYAIIAGLNLASFVLVPLIPRRYETGAAGFRLALPSGRGIVALFAVSLNLAGVMALWVYLVPLARHSGFAETVGSTAISYALAAQLTGGLCAGVMGARFKGSTVLLGGGSILAILVSIMGLTGSSVLFTICAAAFAFVWMFVGSFHMPYLTSVEKERGAAMQLPTAQLVGMAAGPAVASAIVTVWSIPVLVIGSGAMLAASVTLAAATIAVSTRHRRMPASPLAAGQEA